MRNIEVNFKGKPIPIGGGCYLSTTDAFYRGALKDVSRTLKAEQHDAATCVIFNDTNMFKHQHRSRLNKAFRIGYLKMKKRYGDDEVQEEAAEIWKLTSEEQQRLSEEGTQQVLSTAFVDALTDLFGKWRDKFTEEENGWIATHVLQEAEVLTSLTIDDKAADQFLTDITPVRLRIRKLTSRECFRLMGLNESEIDTIQATGLSNSAQYKLAGNSIVVDVLTYLFENLFYPPTQLEGQLTLF